MSKPLNRRQLLKLGTQAAGLALAGGWQPAMAGPKTLEKVRIA